MEAAKVSLPSSNGKNKVSNQAKLQGLACDWRGNMADDIKEVTLSAGVEGSDLIHTR